MSEERFDGIEEGLDRLETDQTDSRRHMDDCFDEFRRHMDDRFEELRRYMDVLHQEVLDALTVEAKGAPKLKARLPKLNAACAEELEND